MKDRVERLARRLCEDAGFNSAEAVSYKFNKTSEKYGMKTELPTPKETNHE